MKTIFVTNDLNCINTQGIRSIAKFDPDEYSHKINRWGLQIYYNKGMNNFYYPDKIAP